MSFDTDSLALGEAVDPLESVKRTTEQTFGPTTFGLSRPFHGLRLWLHPNPTDEIGGLLSFLDFAD